MIRILLCVICAAFLLGLTSCGSGGYSAGYSTGPSYYYRDSWDYDRYYRSRVDYHYSRDRARSRVSSEDRARIRSEAASRRGSGEVRSRAGRAGGGRRR